MVTGILLSVVTGILWMLIGVVFSRIAKLKEDAVAFMTVSSFFTLLWSMTFILKWDYLKGGDIPRLKELIIVMALAGVFNTLNSIFMMFSMSKGHSAAIWAIGQSAMVTPFLASIFIWGEKINLAGISGVFFILLMITIFGLKKEEGTAENASKGWIIWALITFMAVSGNQVLSTIPSHWKGWEDVGNLRIPISWLGAFIFQVIAFVLMKKKLNKTVIKYGFLQSVFIILGQKLLFYCMDLLNKVGYISVVYPIAVGVSIIGMTFYSLIIAKEKVDKLSLGAMAAGLAGIILVSLK